LDLDIALTLGALVGVLLVLMLEWLAADVALLLALGGLMVAGVVPVDQALSGFASPTLLTLGALYVVAAALRRTGALELGSRALLGQTRRMWVVILRISAPVAVASAFLNNTPIVALGIPAIQSWAREHEVAPSKLLIPLSYASILGGTCTLMGTSTNLVAHGLLQERGRPGLGFFELAWVGVPAVVVGLAYLVAVAPHLLRSRSRPTPDARDAPEGEELPDEAADREAHRVAVREGSRLVGRTVSEANIFERFHAVVDEVRRNGRPVAGEVSDIRLRAGDTLVLDTGRGFRRAFAEAPEFVVTSEYQEDDERPRPSRRQWVEMGVSLAVLAGIVAVSAAGLAPIAVAAVLGAMGLVAGRVVSAARARDAVDWNVLVVIGAALGLGQAMQSSGTADRIADLIGQAGSVAGPWALLAALVVGTSVLTQLITNNGSVALLFPVALSVAERLSVEPRPLVIGLTVASSLAFITPLGYQTNLMVHAAGDYRFGDFARVGGPLQVLLLALSVILIPLLWPF
jgi:di/tricarboxylate transporter